MYGEFYASTGDTVRLGDAIASGGEGTIHEVVGAPSLLAKICQDGLPPDHSTSRAHGSLRDRERLQKLEAMISIATDDLRRVSTWPSAILFESGRPAASRQAPSGLLMPRAPGVHHVYELYNPSHRMAWNSELRFSHLVRVAANIATAFAVVHQHGHLVADGNQGNVLVSDNGTVTLIDCDSFQIAHRGKVYACPVGVPEYTPPELHGSTFGSAPRTTHQDTFALAVLIFQFLFGGRHPFSGRPVGDRDFGDISANIRAYRYAYASDAQRRGLTPPKGSVPVSTMTPTVALMFERAFTTNDARPRADEWRAALEEMISRKARCAHNSGHDFPNHLGACPWCRLEEGGVLLFVGRTTETDTFSIDSFCRRYDKTMWEWEQAAKRHEADLARLTVPQIAPGDEPRHAYRPFLWRYVHAPKATKIGGALAAVVGRIATRRSPRFALHVFVEEFNALVAAFAEEVADREVLMETEVRRLSEVVSRDIAEYRSAKDARDRERTDLARREREIAEIAYLRTMLIRNASIMGIAGDRAAALSAHGIVSAADITEGAVRAVPGFGRTLTKRLVDWRRTLVRRWSGPSANHSALSVERSRIDRRFEARRREVAARLVRSKAALDRVVAQVAAQQRSFRAEFDPRATALRTQRDEIMRLMRP
jgi:DNA-binding helix-hairpin-helix protein with protein kinase domain